MSDRKPLASIVRRDSKLARTAEPVVDRARIVEGRVVDRLESVDDEIRRLEQKAQRLVEEARREAESIREEARREGRKEGLEECMESLAKARAEQSRLREEAEQEMVTLAFQIARRLVGRTLETSPEVVRDIVGEALLNARGRNQILVYVHPDDYEHVEEARDEYARALDGVPVYFESDPELERGGCVIETESGRIDARLETQLQVLRDKLLDTGLDHNGENKGGTR